jgi:hypothetical protein
VLLMLLVLVLLRNCRLQLLSSTITSSSTSTERTCSQLAMPARNDYDKVQR